MARVFSRNQQSHNEQIKNLPHAKFVIRADQRRNETKYLLSILGRRYRSVWHLSWYEFNEQHCPKNLSQFLKFLEELSSVRLASVSEVPPGHNCNPPLMIHCNEGDKTGLTLVADLLLYTMDHNQVRSVINPIQLATDPSLISGSWYSSRDWTAERATRQNHSVARPIQIHLLTFNSLSSTNSSYLTTRYRTLLTLFHI